MVVFIKQATLHDDLMSEVQKHKYSINGNPSKIIEISDGSYEMDGAIITQSDFRKKIVYPREFKNIKRVEGETTLYDDLMFGVKGKKYSEQREGGVGITGIDEKGKVLVKPGLYGNDSAWIAPPQFKTTKRVSKSGLETASETGTETGANGIRKLID